MISNSFLADLLGRFRGRPHAARYARDPRDAYDVVIVGGGVRALAAAGACAGAGASVALFAPDEIAAAPDERAWPVIRSAVTDRSRAASDTGAADLLARVARQEPRPLSDRTGCLTTATGRFELDALSDAALSLKALGRQCWMVPGREVASLCPPLGGASEPGPALFEPGALTVDADALALALAGAATGLGAALFPAAPVTALERDGARVAGVRLGERLVRARAVALADDFAAIRLVREGRGRLSLTRDEREILITVGGAPSIGPAIAAGDLRATRDAAGALTFSGPRGADALARRIVTLAPALAGVEITRREPVTVWKGVDGRPQVGAAEFPGLWLALGYGRDALSLALPAGAELAAQIGGRRTTEAFEPFAPTRRPAARAMEAAR